MAVCGQWTVAHACHQACHTTIYSLQGLWLPLVVKQPFLSSFVMVQFMLIFIALEFELNPFFANAWTLLAKTHASPIHVTAPVFSFSHKLLTHKLLMSSKRWIILPHTSSHLRQISWMADDSIETLLWLLLQFHNLLPPTSYFGQLLWITWKLVSKSHQPLLHPHCQKVFMILCLVLASKRCYCSIYNSQIDFHPLIIVASYCE